VDPCLAQFFSLANQRYTERAMAAPKQSYTQTAGRLRQREMTSSNQRYTERAMAAPKQSYTQTAGRLRQREMTSSNQRCIHLWFAWILFNYTNISTCCISISVIIIHSSSLTSKLLLDICVFNHPRILSGYHTSTSCSNNLYIGVIIMGSCLSKALYI